MAPVGLQSFALRAGLGIAAVQRRGDTVPFLHGLHTWFPRLRERSKGYEAL
jgi:hypothetical protein